MGLSLEDLLLFNQGEQLVQTVKGRGINIWIRSGIRDTKEYIYPEIRGLGRYEILLGADININDNQVLIRTFRTFTIHRNDCLMFADNKAIVIKQSTILDSNNVNGTAVAIYPSEHDIAQTEGTMTYAMLPLISAKEGGYLQITTSYAEGHNKNQGLYPVSQKIKEDGIATITGDINLNDPCLELLEQIQNEGLSKIFVQLRHEIDSNISNDLYGEGVGAIEYWAIPNCSLSDPENGLINFTLQMKLIQNIIPYKILRGVTVFKYCPIDYIALGFYNIDFVVIPEEDICGYCPQDTTNFFDFAQTP